MERLYKALVWLASIAIVLGLVISYLLAMTAINRYPPGLTVSSSDGLVGAFFKVLSFQTTNTMLGLSNLLNGGVITLAVTLAWANRRRAWLIALIILTLLTLAWPSFTIAWADLNYSQGSAGISESQIQTFNFIVLSAPLIPVAVALIFGLIRRKPAAATTDAELDIVRSAL